jgi:hypothetical protein
MPSEQVLSEIRKRYVYKKVMVDSIGPLFGPKHVLLATANANSANQMYHTLLTYMLTESVTPVLLTASTVGEALERGSRVKPDILVIDKFLPPSGGYDFYYRLEETWKEEMPPALMVLPPGDNSPLQRPNYGLIYLYRGVFKPVAVMQGISTIFSRQSANRPAPRPAPQVETQRCSPIMAAAIA